MSIIKQIAQICIDLGGAFGFMLWIAFIVEHIKEIRKNLITKEWTEEDEP